MKTHIAEFGKIAPALEKEMGFLPRVITFQHYATLLTEDGKYDDAIDICNTALKFGLDDGTKSGFQGRIERIKKQATKSKNTATV
jgi:hypothetical protein